MPAVIGGRDRPAAGRTAPAPRLECNAGSRRLDLDIQGAPTGNGTDVFSGKHPAHGRQRIAGRIEIQHLGFQVSDGFSNHVPGRHRAFPGKSLRHPGFRFHRRGPIEQPGARHAPEAPGGRNRPAASLRQTAPAGNPSPSSRSAGIWTGSAHLPGARSRFPPADRHRSPRDFFHPAHRMLWVRTGKTNRRTGPDRRENRRRHALEIAKCSMRRRLRSMVATFRCKAINTP